MNTALFIYDRSLSLSLAPWELRFELQFSLSLWHRDSSRDSRNFSIDFQVSFGQRAFYELCKILPSLYREISSILLLVKNCFAQLIEMYSVCHQAWCMWNVICLIYNIKYRIEYPKMFYWIQDKNCTIMNKKFYEILAQFI